MKRSTPHNLMNSELSALRFLFVSCAVVKVYVWAVNSFLEKRRWNSCQSLRHTLPSGLHMPESVKKETGHFLSITPFAERISNRSSDTLRAGGDIDSLSCILGFLISYSCIRKRFSECHIDGRPFAPLSPKIFHPLPAPPRSSSGSLSVREVAALLQQETLQLLKKECGGLQTLLKNNHQVFKGTFRAKTFSWCWSCWMQLL